MTPLIAAPDLTVSLADGGASGILPGGVISYTLTYANLGTRGSSGVTVRVDLPLHVSAPGSGSSSGWTCVPSGAVVRCSRAVGALSGGGASQNATLGATLGSPLTASASPVVAIATISDDGTNGADSAPTNNSASAATPMGAFAPTALQFASLRNPANTGDAVTFSFQATEASGALPVGSVQVREGATVLCSATLSSGSGSCVASGLTTGSHTLAAHYLGGLVFLGSSSPPLSETVINPTPLASGDVKISEFRFRGPAGSQDEYVELFNATAGPITVGADGLTARAWNGGVTTTLGAVPAATVLPAGGYYLFTNNTPGTGFSLGSYPAGSGTVGGGDQTFSGDLGDGSGLALFKNGLVDLTNRLDAVGFASVTDTLYREGVGLSPSSGIGAGGQWTFVRQAPGGVVKETGDNASDFSLVAADAGVYTSTTAILGAPGPRSGASEAASGLVFTAADPTKGLTTFPNRYRVSATTTTGTYFFRWKVTNNTAAPISSLRVRVTSLTTLNSPGYVPGGTQADFRLVPSSSVSIAVPGSVTALGLTLEPPSGSPLDGGWNASARVTLPGGTLGAGASVYVNLAFCYAQAGAYSYYVQGEGKP